MDKVLTKQQVIKMFKQGMSGLPRGDWIKEEWKDFLDMLCKDEHISNEQHQEWISLY